MRTLERVSKLSLPIRGCSDLSLVVANASLKLVAVFFLVTLTFPSEVRAQEGASITWESYKDVEFDFGDSLMRINSEYEAYAFATGGPSEWASTPPNKEPTLITGPYTSELQSIVAAQPRATASALTSWFLHADEQAGTASLANAAAGTTAIDDKYDPTVVAMSWAAQSTSVELGEEVSQGMIDWSPGISVGTGGGAFLSSYDTISIHDPIVVWTQQVGSDVRTPTTVFELNAEFDTETQFHWNRIRRIQTGIDGEPQLVVVPNDGPFLDAGENGTGSFTLRMENELLPANRQGAISVVFEDGIVTSSSATGVFSAIAPNEAQPIGSNRLPMIGSPAKIDAIVLTSQLQPQPAPDLPDAIDRFALNLAVDASQTISDVAACSDGVHVSVGPAIDTIQTFALNPMQREEIKPVVTLDGAPSPTLGACLGEISQDADLLFGTDYEAGTLASLHRESASNQIDRFLRLRTTRDVPTQVAFFEQGENRVPTDTRRWNATFDVRRTGVAVAPVDPVDAVPTDELPIGNFGPGDVLSNSDENVTTQTLVDTRASFAIGLLNVATYGSTSEQADETRSASGDDVDLFDRADGFVLKVTESTTSSVARLMVGKRTVLEADITEALQAAGTDEDPWQHFEFELLERSDGLEIQINLNDRDGELIYRIGQRKIPEMRLSDSGYRVAVGSKTETERLSGLGHDFDNLILTFQDNADLAWDGKVNAADFHRMRVALENETKLPLYDVNYDGLVDSADLAVIEEMIADKIPGDTDLSGRVTFSDFLVLSKSYGQETLLWSEGDFDGDGFVRFPDFLALSRNYEIDNASVVQSGAINTVPEPTTSSMLLLCVASLLVAVRYPSAFQPRASKRKD